jgi:undecaprenyl diphosphate synthase
MPSSRQPQPKLHVAIIMDGNGRWASRQGLPRTVGHRAGAETMRRISQAAPDLGITTLTFFAFSAYNWQRAPAEVDGLMRLLGDYLRSETQNLIDSGARLSLIGRRDRLPIIHCDRLARIEQATAGGRRLHIRIAVDYSARASIEAAAKRWAAGSMDRFGRLVAECAPEDPDEEADVDLLIRTGGDKRLSDFLLWESAFAELLFTDQMWPDFDEAALKSAIGEFRARERTSILPEGRRPWEQVAQAAAT